ncbi:hypothetical protein HHL17_26885 [Chitinophaga sp. G-6-1-13]|uniref:Uncharacterized protein n=1 Tax=Chitinophaga fulva TaxID=2728842 RepID=A0A848GUL2_9BACT|nr:hypothetical protein [Chitinophaga fulva]NML40852.1 hypothetical protein [Chitinophaga fulva]
MQIELSKEKLNSLCTKAKESLSACISDKENEFLREELGVPWTSVLVMDSGVKIAFSGMITETYTVEVYLKLYVAGEQIGEYTYYEDEKGVPQDDSFVLY